MTDTNTDTLDIYRNRMFKPTTRKDLQLMLGNKVNIVTYEELKNIKSFDQLMNPYNCAIILYPSKDDPDVGHWCCVFIMPGNDNNKVQYFDPYGTYIDKNLEKYNNGIYDKRKLEPLLLDLLLDSQYANSVYWNESSFQSQEEPTMVCGLWCVMRIKCNDMNEYEFKKYYLEAPEHQDIMPDLLVSAIICDTYPEMSY